LEYWKHKRKNCWNLLYKVEKKSKNMNVKKTWYKTCFPNKHKKEKLIESCKKHVFWNCKNIKTYKCSKHDTKHDRNKNLTFQNHVRIILLYSILPSNLKPPPFGMRGCLLPILWKHLLQLMGYIMFWTLGLQSILQNINFET